MTRNTQQLIGGILIFACIAATSIQKGAPEKKYSISHTIPEWTRQIQGLSYAQSLVHQSTLPANEAFICDSILQAQIMDINRQVVAAMAADSTNNKTKKP